MSEQLTVKPWKLGPNLLTDRVASQGLWACPRLLVWHIQLELADKKRSTARAGPYGRQCQARTVHAPLRPAAWDRPAPACACAQRQALGGAAVGMPRRFQEGAPRPPPILLCLKCGCGHHSAPTRTGACTTERAAPCVRRRWAPGARRSARRRQQCTCGSATLSATARRRQQTCWRSAAARQRPPRQPSAALCPGAPPHTARLESWGVSAQQRTSR